MSDTPDVPEPAATPEAPLEPSTPPSADGASANSKTKVWLAIGAIVVVGVGGFIAARALSGNNNASASSNTLPPTTSAGGAQNGRGFGNFANRGTIGKITALNSPNFTVQSVTFSGAGGGPGSSTPPATTAGPSVTVNTSSSKR